MTKEITNQQQEELIDRTQELTKFGFKLEDASDYALLESLALRNVVLHEDEEKRLSEFRITESKLREQQGEK